MHVLILGARAPVCLEWARAFDKAQWDVTVADSVDWPLARFSRAAHSYLRLPEPRDDPSYWIDVLSTIVKDRAVDLILPTCEETFYLAHGREKLKLNCQVMTMDLLMMQRLHHKGMFAAMTDGWTVSAPETRILESAEDLMPYSPESEKWVFKPAYSRFAALTLIRPSAAQIRKIQPNQNRPWVAQRFVAGREHCSFSILLGGRLRAHACYHPRYRVGRGSGIYFQPTDPPEIRQFVEQFGDATKYTGQVGFDFIESNDGSFRVLECNPRGTSGIHLFDGQALELVEALTGTDPWDKVLLATPTQRMVTLAMLIFAAPKSIFQPDFYKHFMLAKDVITQRGDMRPLPGQLAGFFELVGRAFTRQCGILEAATADIEWDGQPMKRKSE